MEDVLRDLAKSQEQWALEADAVAREARRRKSLLLKLCSANTTTWTATELFDSFDAVLDATNNPNGPSCTLGVCFNLMLVTCGHRPGYCVQGCDLNNADGHVYSRALSLVEFLPQLSTVECKIGTIIVRSDQREAVALKLAEAAELGTLDTAVGQVLGYAFAGELSEFHKQRGRFSVVLHIEQSPDEERQELTGKSCVMAMIGTGEAQHSLSVVMQKAVDLRDVASSLGRGLRVTFQVRLFDEDEHRPEDTAVKKKVVDASIDVGCCAGHDEIISESAALSCTEDMHHGGIVVEHDGHNSIVVGDELHCTHSDHSGAVVGCHVTQRLLHV